ncbi:MAG: XTP/dITP diphosphatase [Thermodesulfovibrionaceae bacterium]
MKIVLASRNKKKADELRRILRDLDIILLSMEDFPDLEEVVEDGITFEENALKKARYVSKLTNLPALADDSGLEVEILNGAPGVFSARYAGETATDEDNISKLLSELKNVPFHRRKARFVCVIALVFPAGKEYIFKGFVNGFITEKPRGSQGFGYDPVFQPDGYEKTFAEMEPSKKDEISHRGKALEELKSFLKRYKQNLL